MTSTALPFSVGDICKAVTDLQDAAHPKFWTVISWLWSWWGLAVVCGLVVWVIFEILTRHGNLHYNSDNGFSPTFNRVVGSGTYLVFQGILYFILTKIFGTGVYCKPISYAVHVSVFFLTKLFLYGIGFWVYLDRPRRRRRS